MLYIIAVDKKQLPHDCFDLHYHVKNVLQNTVDYTNKTELFINHYLYSEVNNSIAPWQKIVNLTYRIQGDSILFAWEVRDE